MNKRYEEGRKPSFLNQAKHNVNSTFGQKTKRAKNICRKQKALTFKQKLKAMQTNATLKTSSEKQVLTRSLCRAFHKERWTGQKWILPNGRRTSTNTIK